MRLVTIEVGGQGRAGVEAGEGILDLGAAASAMGHAPGLPGTVRGILEAGEAGLELVRRLQGETLSAGGSLGDRLRAQGALLPAGQARLLAPIPDARMVLSCGVNYRAHILEMGGTLPGEPVAFLKSVNAIIGPDAPIVLPRDHPNMVDWEAEFSAVIGRPCHNVSAGEALDYVAGYTMINDVSARDWVRPMGTLVGMEATQAWDRNLLGKQFPSFCPMGPALALKDEIKDPNAARFQLSVNGQTKQDAVTDDLVFNVAALIAHYSQFYRFLPGDVITTGSPAGVGMGHKPFVFLKPGDVVEIRAEGIGAMRNPVVAEQA